MTSSCSRRLLRRAILALVLGSPLASHVARADIQLGASSLRATSRARVDPNTTEKVDMVENVPDPGTLHGVFVQATASDSAVISESVNTTGQVEVTAPDAFVVHLTTMRSGTDDTADEPGGVYTGLVTFELAFLALGDGTLTVGESVTFTRPNTGTFTPLGLSLESGALHDTRPIEVPFDDTSGTGGKPEAFTIQNGRGYLLRIDILMSGATSDVSQAESWDAVFTVQLPPVAPLGTSTTTTTTITAPTTTTTLAPLCPFATPGACAPKGLSRSIARRLKQGCTLADRAGTASESRATKLRKRSDAKLLGACRATSKAGAKGKLSAECMSAVLGALGTHCGG